MAEPRVNKNRRGEVDRLTYYTPEAYPTTVNVRRNRTEQETRNQYLRLRQQEGTLFASPRLDRAYGRTMNALGATYRAENANEARLSDVRQQRDWLRRSTSFLRRNNRR